VVPGLSLSCSLVLFCTLLPLAVAQESSVRPSLRKRDSSTSSSPAAAEAVQESLRGSLALANQTLARSVPKLRVIQWAGGECYLPEDFRAAIWQTRSSLEKGLKTQDLRALKAYSDAYFHQLDRAMPPVRQVSVGGPFSRRTYEGVDKGPADAVFQNLHEFIQKLSHLDPLAVDLSVSSQPPGAEFQVQVGKDAESQRVLTTDNRLQRVWRGLYIATIRMDGFKDFTFDLDLVDDSRGEIDCKLVLANQPGTSTCSRLPR
jgi:hypothetical protein